MKFLIILWLLISPNLSAQNLETDTIIYDIVEKTAVPENGYPYLYEQLKRNLRLKKTINKHTLDTSKFRLEIIVNTDNTCELKGIKPDVWDLELLKDSIENIKWIPAEDKGRKVRQKMIIPMQACFIGE